MATFQEMIGVVIPEKLREIEAREDVKILHSTRPEGICAVISTASA